ncbi:hypothetical protein HED54_25390 [Ochrobactrum anthropi ATCC 49188]|nr:hypothetical protein [Brucella anthropi ATCC 49188]
MLGITIMAPYTRFPDYVLRLPRVMFPLSPGEYKSISGEWKSHQIGSPIVCAAGREFAMRCASHPLLSYGARGWRPDRTRVQFNRAEALVPGQLRDPNLEDRKIGYCNHPSARSNRRAISSRALRPISIML